MKRTRYKTPYNKVLMAVAATMVCAACSTPMEKYRIGVSQCSEDSWREKQNEELLMSQYADPQIELEICSAADDDARQRSQIERFVEQKVDLLIVAPNSAEGVDAAIGKARESGIPVVLFDRKSKSDNYTAFMGTDNHQLGEMMGRLIGNEMGGRGTVVEIKGLEGSSPAMERHRGFMDAMSGFPEIKVVESGDVEDWTEASGEKAMRGLLKEFGGRIDCVFGHNDRLAMGARKVAMSEGRTEIKYYGVDALPSAGGGMEMVKEGKMEATCIYPTRGLQLMRLATDILDGREFKRENILTSTIVDKNNVEILLSQNIEQRRVSDDLNVVKDKLDVYFSQVNIQRKIIVACVVVLIIIITLGVLAYRLYVAKVQVNEEVAKDVVAPADAPQTESPFLERFRKILQDNLHDPDFNVERIGEEMGMSRVQLYRKIKALTDMTPVELLRKARVARGRQLLDTTDRTITEIAYDTGFSASSYFAKCFKDEYGVSPGEIRGGKK